MRIDNKLKRNILFSKIKILVFKNILKISSINKNKFQSYISFGLTIFISFLDFINIKLEK